MKLKFYVFYVCTDINAVYLIHRLKNYNILLYSVHLSIIYCYLHMSTHQEQEQVPPTAAIHLLCSGFWNMFTRILFF